MQAKSLRDKTVEELSTELVGLTRTLFGYRLQRADDRLAKTHLLTLTRRDIARVKTVLVEKKRAAQQTSPTVKSTSS